MKGLVKRIYNFCISKPLQVLREFPQLQQDYEELETQFTSAEEQLRERATTVQSLESQVKTTEDQRQKDQEFFTKMKETYQKHIGSLEELSLEHEKQIAQSTEELKEQNRRIKSLDETRETAAISLLAHYLHMDWGESSIPFAIYVKPAATDRYLLGATSQENPVTEKLQAILNSDDNRSESLRYKLNLGKRGNRKISEYICRMQQFPIYEDSAVVVVYIIPRPNLRTMKKQVTRGLERLKEQFGLVSANLRRIYPKLQHQP